MDFAFVNLTDDMIKQIDDLDLLRISGTDDTGPAIGDIVQLASGSPDMTVISLCPHGCVEVAWYDDNGMNIDVFPIAALILDDGEYASVMTND